MEKKNMSVDASNFRWIDQLNPIEGRKNLGNTIPAEIYRNFEYSMRQALEDEFGKEKTIELLRKAGYLYGEQYAKTNLDLSTDLNTFLAELQKQLIETKVAILRVEDFDIETGDATLTMSEDLDCSGLPIIGDTVCNYDEGFIAGILSVYTKKNYQAIEIDCWAKGDRVCRFEASVIEEG